METIGIWFRKNASIVIMLLAIFCLALFLRAYFPLDISLQEHLLSGGSDSYYYERITRHIVDTGHQLDWDPMLNYPMGLGNPRPPLFSWLVAVPGIIFSPLLGDVWQSVMTVFILSTAIWGALTVFPTYFLTKSIFGRRAGLIAAFLLAIMPAHLQRSQATDADHDSMVLFFVVTSFFFFMKALHVLNERRWIASWNFATKDGRSSIWTGMKDFIESNRKSILYSVMAGLAMAVVALIWQGWAYAPIILLVYVVLQLFVDRLRDKDPMGKGICFTITMGTALLVAAPWYILYGQVKVWYDVPLILFLAATALGVALTITRNYPWALIIPTILAVGVSLIAILAIINPAVATAFVSGAGYFVRTKLYETIAEAQAPGISQAILSFGAATYYISLFGLFWMAWKLPKRIQPDYMFILVWSAAAIFMSMAAARFIFNASPAFALTAGWIIGILVEKLDFETMKKTYLSLSGGSRLTAIRKSIKVKHVLGALVIVFLLLLPNVWYGVDASIPYEHKAIYDRQVYYAMPDFMRPQGYTPPTGRSGGTFYFGAFGYSLPLSSTYFPSAWRWFAEQDEMTQPEERPAYISWWDYGFEAVDRGKHPTVADNFQDGYQLAGQFITAQSEDQAIGLLILRLIDGDYYGNRGELSSGVSTALQRYGINPDKIVDAYRNSESLISTVLGDPIKYGRWDSRMQATNALYIYLSQYIHEVTTTDQIASLYHDISDATGWSIRYFGVDSRMFPYSGGGNNIFYAPVKLSDHRVQQLPDGRVLPIDFFGIEAQTDKGTFPAALVPLGAQVKSYDIKYTDMLYNSMFYRAYMGFGPTDIDQTCSTNDCLPGIRGELQTSMPMQGWNLSHFKVVYKTAYYNPWSVYDYQNHSEDWGAVNYFDALTIQRKINRGDAVGVIDFSNSTLAQSGVVFLKYYDGAYVNGTVTIDGIIPLSGVRVTVQDYEDPSNPTPHYSTLTDDYGRYSLIAPFGSLRVVASVGELTKRTMIGATILDQKFITITDDQAMRKEVDQDQDGKLDYEIDMDISVRGVTVGGTVFLDHDRNGSHTPDEGIVANSQVSFHHSGLHLIQNVTTNNDGEYLLTHAYEGSYLPSIDFKGRTINAPSVTVGKTTETKDIALNTTRVEGSVYLPGNVTAKDAEVEAVDHTWPQSVLALVNDEGRYSLNLLPGNFAIRSIFGLNASIPTQIAVGESSPQFFNMTLRPSGTIAGRTSIGGIPQGFAHLDFDKVSGGIASITATSDSAGFFSVDLPAGIYDVSSRHYKASSLYAYVGRVTVVGGEETVLDPVLSEGIVVSGEVRKAGGITDIFGILNVTFSSGQGTFTARTSLERTYRAYLPKDDYIVYASYTNSMYLTSRRFDTSQVLDIELQSGSSAVGRVTYDKNRDGLVEQGEGVAEVGVTFVDSSGLAVTAFTSDSGIFELTLPASPSYTATFSKAGFRTVSFGPATLETLAQSLKPFLVPLNVTVHGTVLEQSSPIIGKAIAVELIPTGEIGIAESVTVNPISGSFDIPLAPGEYRVKVDDTVDPFEPLVRYQNITSQTLVINVGQPDVTIGIPVAVRVSVSGTTKIGGVMRAALVVIQGPEKIQFSTANGSFSLMLAKGTYTLYANHSLGDTLYAAYQEIVISAPSNLDVNLQRASSITGHLIYKGSNLPETAALLFISDKGIRMESATSEDGSYSTSLIPGNYTISIEHHSSATFDGIRRLVRYTGNVALEVKDGAHQIFQDIDLELALDNTTLKGRLDLDGMPSAGILEFRPMNPDGLNVTGAAASNGIFSVDVTPGDYVLYVFDSIAKGVLLRNITIEHKSEMYLDLELARGHKVSGITTYLGGTRVSSSLIFSHTVDWTIFSDDTGYYELFLPPQEYSLRAQTTMTEHGLPVEYDGSSAVDIVDGPVVKNLQLARVPRREVSLSYDESEVLPVSPGATIEYEIEVTNNGNSPDTIRLEGATVDWTFTFDRNPVPVDFGSVNGLSVKTEKVVATLRVPFGAEVEHPQVSIIGSSVNDTNARFTLNLKVDVERSKGILLRVSDSDPVFDGRFLNYTLDVVNTGNGAESVGVSVDNAGDVEIMGWKASVLTNRTTPMAASVEGITVPSNSTIQVTIVIRSVGGRTGVGVLVRAYLQNATGIEAGEARESKILIPTVMPLLRLQGNVAVGGGNIERQTPMNTTLVAVTAALGFVAALFIISAARDRWRRSRR